MKGKKIILKHFIAIALLLLIPITALCCEKESPLIIEDSERLSDIDGAVYKTIKIVKHGLICENLNVSLLMKAAITREAEVREEWVSTGIQYEPAWDYKNNDFENREKTGKEDNWNVAYDPIGFDVFLCLHFVIGGALLIISGIMTYNLIRDNLFNYLRHEKKD
jgi:hypothetical protein